MTKSFWKTKRIFTGVRRLQKNIQKTQKIQKKNYIFYKIFKKTQKIQKNIIYILQNIKKKSKKKKKNYIYFTKYSKIFKKTQNIYIYFTKYSKKLYDVCPTDSYDHLCNVEPRHVFRQSVLELAEEGEEVPTAVVVHHQVLQGREGEAIQAITTAKVFHFFMPGGHSVLECRLSGMLTNAL